ncbi:hypothetical protein EAF04_003884 [Stromatinia cepivora]|nr:hypothetical protein EAF04_003884 [Stromatinia cepivora]
MKPLNSIFACVATLLTLHITSGLAQSTRWWRIADDCTPEQANFIRAGVDSACTMAVNALAAAGQNDLGSGDPSLAPSQKQQDLIVWLFGDFTIGVRNRIGAMFEARNGILSMRNREAPAGMDLGINDIKFYCTTKRYVPKIGVGHGSLMYDTDIQAAAEVSDKVTCLLSLMWTSNARNLKENTGHFQIQICPWFLDYASRAPFKWTSGILRQFWAKFTPLRWFIRPAAAWLVYSAVDSVSLFEKVLLHEVCIFC